MEVETEALVLRRFDFGETSQIGHFLTPDAGRLSVIAKGIKKPNPSLKGPMDLFQLAKVKLRRRRGSDLALLTRYEPLTGFAGLRRRLERMYAAFYLVELARQLITEESSAPLAFQLVARALGALESAEEKRVAAVLLAAEVGLLEDAGFGLSLACCASCGRPFESERPRLWPAAGGRVCADCPAPRGRSIEMSRGSLALLKALSGTEPRTASRLRISQDQARELRRLLHEVWIEIRERPLASEPFVRDRRHGFLRIRGRNVDDVPASS